MVLRGRERPPEPLAFAPTAMALSSWVLSPALQLCAAGPACSWEMLHVAGAGTLLPPLPLPHFASFWGAGLGLGEGSRSSWPRGVVTSPGAKIWGIWGRYLQILGPDLLFLWFFWFFFFSPSGEPLGEGK